MKTRRQRRRIWYLVALLVLAVVVPVCAEDEPETVTLQYFTWSGGVAGQYIQEDWIDEFEKLYPHIKIEYSATSFSDFWNKLPTMIASGISPDLIHMSVGYVYDYAEMGLLYNLQPWFDRDLNADDFFMEPAAAVRYPYMHDGDLYAIPFGFVTTVLFYNRNHFDTAGVGYPDATWTWEDVRAAAGKLTRDTTGDGANDIWGFHASYGYSNFDLVIHSFGGATLNDDFTEVLLDQPEAIAAIEFWQGLIWQDGVAPDPATSSSVSFGRGNLSMSLELTTNIPELRRVADFDWDIAMTPAGPVQRVVRLWPDSFAIPITSKHPEEAWEFIKFVIQRTEMDRYNGPGKIPFLKEAATSPDWMEYDMTPNKQVILDSIPYGQPLEFRPKWGEWQARRNSEVRPAFENKIPVATALKNAANAIRATLGLPLVP